MSVCHQTPTFGWKNMMFEAANQLDISCAWSWSNPNLHPGGCKPNDSSTRRIRLQGAAIAISFCSGLIMRWEWGTVVSLSSESPFIGKCLFCFSHLLHNKKPQEDRALVIITRISMERILPMLPHGPSSVPGLCSLFWIWPSTWPQHFSLPTSPCCKHIASSLVCSLALLTIWCCIFCLKSGWARNLSG